MKKLKFGHDPRKLTGSTDITAGTLVRSLPKNPELRTPPLEETIRKVMDKHAEVFKKLAEAEKAEADIKTSTALSETILKETIIKTHDKLARRHSRLSRKKMDASLDQLTESMSHQDELFHSLKRGIANLVAKQDVLLMRIQVLESRKPEEKHTVTELVATPIKTSKLVLAGLVLSLVLNAVILLTK